MVDRLSLEGRPSSSRTSVVWERDDRSAGSTLRRFPQKGEAPVGNTFPVVCACPVRIRVDSTSPRFALSVPSTPLIGLSRVFAGSLP